MIAIDVYLSSSSFIPACKDHRWVDESPPLPENLNRKELSR